MSCEAFCIQQLQEVDGVGWFALNIFVINKHLSVTIFDESYYIFFCIHIRNFWNLLLVQYKRFVNTSFELFFC